MPIWVQDLEDEDVKISQIIGERGPLEGDMIPLFVDEQGNFIKVGLRGRDYGFLTSSTNPRIHYDKTADALVQHAIDAETGKFLVTHIPSRFPEIKGFSPKDYVFTKDEDHHVREWWLKNIPHRSSSVDTSFSPKNLPYLWRSFFDKYKTSLDVAKTRQNASKPYARPVGDGRNLRKYEEYAPIYIGPWFIAPYLDKDLYDGDNDLVAMLGWGDEKNIPKVQPTSSPKGLDPGVHLVENPELTSPKGQEDQTPSDVSASPDKPISLTKKPLIPSWLWWGAGLSAAGGLLYLAYKKVKK